MFFGYFARTLGSCHSVALLFPFAFCSGVTVEGFLMFQVLGVVFVMCVESLSGCQVVRVSLHVSIFAWFSVN